MSSAKQRTTLTNLSEPQQMRELNRQLSWIWDQLLGGLNMKSLSADARGIIESKIGGEELESAIRQSEDEIMLEVKKPASEVDTGEDGGVQVKISQNKFEVNVPGEDGDFELNETGGKLPVLVGNDISAPNVSPRYEGERLLTVDPNATAEQMEAWGVYRSLSDALSAVNGRQLEGKLQINCADGAVMYGDVELAGVCGGEIEINGVDVMLYGRMTISGCSCTVYINKLGITAAEGAALSVSGAGQMVRLWACDIGSVSADAVEAADGAKIDAVECTLRSESGKAAYMMRTAYGAFENCIGKGMLAARKAMLSAVGTVPDGGCEDWGGAIMNTEGTIPTGTGSEEEPTVPETQTLSYTMLHSDSYRGSWSWTADNDIRQGYTGGRIRGCMWFDNDLIRADLAGKTIRQASLRLYAMTGVGRGVAVTAELYGTDKEYEGRSGAPALTASYGVIGSFEPGEVTTITIPTQVIDDLVSGVINGLMLYSSDTELYSGRDYSRNYARFAGETSADEETVPVLTVTTEGSQDASEVNQIPISTDTDGSVYNGIGYKTKTRINSSGVPVDVYNPNAVNAVFATGFIPVGSGDVMRLKGCYIAIEDFGGGDIASDDTCSYGQSLWGTRIGLYDSDKKLTAVCSWGSLHDGLTDVLTSYSAVGGKITQFAVAAEGAAYIRLSLAAEGDAADAVVTMTAGGSAGIGDDGSGNAVISGAVLADDGAGNVTLSGAVLTDDGNGNVRMQ